MTTVPVGKPSSRPGVEGLRFDLLARIIPGLVFMTLAALLFYPFHRKAMTGMAAFLLDVGHAWWVGLAVLFGLLAVAYAIGQAIDALAGQWLIRRFALAHFAAAVPAESATVDAWDAMRACVSTQAHDMPETTTLLRAQAESRSLTNLGIACLVFALAFAPSLCFIEGARQGTFMLYVYSSLVGGLVLLLAGYSLQRRRVAAVVALARSRHCACTPGGQCPFRVG
jgi:hypothetical protein